MSLVPDPFRAGILALLALLALPAPPVGAGEVPERAALLAASQRWAAAFDARDADAMSALATEDVVLLPPNAPPIRGRQAVQDHWRRGVSVEYLSVTLVTEEAVVSPGFAYEIGTLAYSLPNGEELRTSKFLRIWKQLDGRWRIHRDMYSGNRPIPKPRLAPIQPPNEPALDSDEPPP